MRPLADLMSGEIVLTKDINPEVFQLLQADINKFEYLAQLVTNMSWYASNYIALEPLQKKILAFESQEKKICQLLHLARLRGGISDLLEIISMDSSD